MDWLNKLREGLKSGYESFDTTIGGVLPGGAQLDLGGLGGEVGRDVQKAVLPGWGGGKALDKGVARAHAVKDDLVTGNVPGAAGGATGNIIGAKTRAHVVEEIMEKLGKQVAKTGAKKLGTRFATGLIPGGQGVALADTAKDLADMYSTVLETTTGKTLGEHAAVHDGIKKRNTGTDAFLGSLSPSYRETQYGPSTSSGDTNAQWGQGDPNHNYALQEAKNRVQMFKENFNPLRGDWGVTELTYGDTDSNNYLSSKVTANRRRA